MAKLNKKEFKRLKKEVVNGGIRSVGYYYSLKNEFNFNDVMNVLGKINDCGFDLSILREFERDEIVLDFIVKGLGFQDFKNKVVPHLLGF